MDIQNEIIKTIDILINKKFEKTVIPKDVPTIVKSITKNKKYVVIIDGAEHTVPCGVNIGNITVGMPVWVHLPDRSNPSTAFIIAKR